MGDVIPIKKPAFVCGGCKYLGWRGLVKWCRHPAHVVRIKPAGKCPDFIDLDAKVMPGNPAPWPEPVNLQEVN